MARQTENKAGMSKNADVNPLRNERIFIRFVPQSGKYGELSKGHPLYGGLADGAEIRLSVPVLRSTGAYKNILTDAEKSYLEKALGLDDNALSVYRKVDNYWDDYVVSVKKEGLHLNLADPEDYIRFKVLQANSDIVAPSVHERQERPKATYRFEIVRESEENKVETVKVDTKMQCYMELGKILNDADTMRVLTELLDNRPYGINTDTDFFKARLGILIENDPKKFLTAVTDELLPTKVVIRRCVELGKVSKRGDNYYLASDSSPLCGNGEYPTLTMAAAFLNAPENQEIKFALESEVEKSKV